MNETKNPDSTFKTWVAAIALAAIAALQWTVLAERSIAAIWAWYKLSNYSGGGHITAGRETQIIFFVVSIVCALAGWQFSRSFSHGRAMKVARWSSLAVIVGVIYWTALLISPLVRVTR